jgi:uncharacterized protein DUF3303
MKFMVEYHIRSAGLTYDQNIANQQALLTAFSKWKPEDGLKVHAFLGKVSASAGYVLIESNDEKVVQSFVSKFQYWNDITVVPVTDIGDSVAIGHASLAWASTASKS